MNLSIEQRRYLGNKNLLLPFLESVITSECTNVESVGDFFAGTGVVSSYFNNFKLHIVSNELLYANFCTISAFLGDEIISIPDYQKLVLELTVFADQLIEKRANKLSNAETNKVENVEINKVVNPETNKSTNTMNEHDVQLPTNYFRENFGGTYFSNIDAYLIGELRERINQLNLSRRLKYALIATLIYSSDRIAYTCGHYDAYRKGVPKKSIFKLLPLALKDGRENKGNIILNNYAQKIANLHFVDVAYLDPPYNSRQYCDSYHLLENLAQWDKPETSGIACKFDRKHLKSDFNQIKAAKAMEELVRSLNCRYILLSYSNMEGKGHSRSSNKITEKELQHILSIRGDVSMFEVPYRAFTTGKANVEDHRERLYLCKVKR